MTKEELKLYLKENLKILCDRHYASGNSSDSDYIEISLELEDEEICKVSCVIE